MQSRILGQAKPAATINNTLVTVAADTQAQFNVFVCNQNATVDDSISIALVPDGATLSVQHYVFFNTRLDKGATAIFNGFCLRSGDTMIVRSTNGDCSFTATGLEI